METSCPWALVRLVWGIVLGLVGAAMILSGSIDAVKKLIALGALPFVFVSVLLCVCLLRGLRDENRGEIADAHR